MVLKKSDLYGSLWRSCDELRGGMDASQYKDYILTLLFVKYVSDKQKSDKDSLIDVPAGGSFDDMIALKGDKEIGDKINIIIGKLAEANRLEKVIDLADFNDEEKLGKGKEMQDRLSKLVTIFADLDFRGSKAEGDDLLGDAYEYLMRHFATESGKSKGQFYTPAEVSRVLAKIVGIGPNTRQDQTVYDPTCGSGSLLLKVAAEAPRGITVYGQEKDNATWALAKMNMILHGNEDADIRKGDTITSPQFTAGGQLQTFDFAVANPPFSVKSWSNGLENEYGLFEYGRPPEKNGDYAFLLHILKSLKSTGKAAVILPHGVLFRGNAEATIRRQLLKRGYIKGIIGLPANLFYGTGIPACILVLDKENAAGRTGVFMIDASKGFVKDGPKNRLRSQDIHKIVDVFNKQTEIDRYSRMVPLTEIADPKNDFNLNIPRYIDSSEPEDVQDLDAHLRGGIPERDIDALSGYWEAFPSLRRELFRPNRPGYVDLTIDVSEVRQMILDSAEFQAFAHSVRGLVKSWYEHHRPALGAITQDTKSNAVIAGIGEDLLARFRSVPLLDEYDVYEQLLSYWHETMHDDFFLVINEGWVGAAKPRPARILGYDKNKKPKYEDCQLQIGSGAKAQRHVVDLIPPEIIVERYLTDAREKVDELGVIADVASRALDEYIEEHAVEEGLIWDAVDEKGKVTQKSAAAALAEATASKDDEAVHALKHVSRLIRDESAARKAAKDAEAELDLETLKCYATVAEGDIKHLVIEDKWYAEVDRRVGLLLSDLAEALVRRVQELGARYDRTLSELESNVAELAARVDASRPAMAPSIRETVTVQLKDLGSTYGGLTGKTKADFGRGDACYVTFLEVINSVRLRGDSLEAVRVRKGESQNRVQRGDLLFNGSSETPEEVALSAVVDFEPSPQTFLNSFCFGYRLRRSEVVDPTYLAYYFRSRVGRTLVSALAQGATRYNIAKTKFLELDLHVPPIDEQRSIVDALCAADDLAAALRRLSSKRADMAMGTQQLLLSGRPADHGQETVA